MVMSYLGRLSSNIVDIVNMILKNQMLVNYIGHNGDFPLTTPVNPLDIAPKGVDERIFTYPFDTSYTEDVRTQLHIYYPSFDFENNNHATGFFIVFDIVVHKDIWLVQDNSRKVIRPYQITEYLVETLKDKRIGNLGKISFVEGNHIIVNQQFEGVRLVAKFTEF